MSALGERNANWKGGRHVDAHGYVLVLMRGHPRANHMGYVREHVLIAERVLGRPLERKHPVHHADEDKGNNASSNLVLCESHGYHMLLEQRTRALKACGNANARRCKFCHRYDRQGDITASGTSAYHRACNAAYESRRIQSKEAERIITAHHGGKL